MSNLQLGTLKYIINHEVTVEDLDTLSMTTFGSLLVHGWITREGNKIVPTKNGHLAYDAYRLAGANFKQHPGEISDRVRTLLHISQLQTVKKAG